MDDWSIGTILLAYDDSQGARAAARLATSLARKNGARIVVVTAFHWSYSLDAMGGQAKREAEEAETLVSRAVDDLKTMGIEATADVLEGQAGEAILRSAETNKADLIVVGRRGHGLTASLLLGSVSEYVVRRAKVPVLVAH